VVSKGGKPWRGSLSALAIVLVVWSILSIYLVSRFLYSAQDIVYFFLLASVNDLSFAAAELAAPLYGSS
jgi:hypothetical protein